MNKVRLYRFFFWTSGLAIPFLPSIAAAGPGIFTIDPSRSQVTLSASILNVTLTPQGPNSLTATYRGSILVNQSGGDVQFPGQSAINANNNGSWQPGPGGVSGSATADYGGLINIQQVGTSYAALRNVVLDLTSLPLPLSGNNFDSSALVFSFATNANPTLDYNTFDGSGSLPLTGYSTNSVLNGATLATSGTGQALTQTLTISIQTQFTFSLITPNDTTLNLNGQIVATNSPPLFRSITMTNQNLVLTVLNATGQSILQSSPDLATWSTAYPTVSTNGTILTYTVPLTAGNSFFRVEQ